MQRPNTRSRGGLAALAPRASGDGLRASAGARDLVPGGEAECRVPRCGEQHPLQVRGAWGMGKAMLLEPVPGELAGTTPCLGALAGRGGRRGPGAGCWKSVGGSWGRGGCIRRPGPPACDPSDYCQACGRRSTGHRATALQSDGDRRERRLSRLSRRILGLRAPFEGREGRIDVVRLVNRARSRVHGLAGNPQGLRLHGVGWGGGLGGRAVRSVTLRYAARAASGTERAVVLSQGPGAVHASAEGRLFSELNAIMGVVPSHSTEALRREYMRRGNIHRDWNLARIRGAEHRRLAVRMDGAPVDVELAYWWKPELVALGARRVRGPLDHGCVGWHDPRGAARDAQDDGRASSASRHPCGAQARV